MPLHRWAFLGALCGALAFGCRPPVAMVNLLLIPLLITFLRRNPPDRGKVLRLFLPRSIRSLREKEMLGWTALLFLLPVIITAIDTSFSIHIVPRYRMDVTFLMGMLTFIAVGIHWENLKSSLPAPAGKDGEAGVEQASERGKNRWAFALCALGILTVIACFLLNCVAYDSTLTEIYPQIRDNIARALFLER